MCNVFSRWAEPINKALFLLHERKVNVFKSKQATRPSQNGATISFVFGSEYYDFSWPLMSGSQLPMGERGPIVSPIPSPQNTKMGAMERKQETRLPNVGHTTQAHAIHASCCVCMCACERERKIDLQPFTFLKGKRKKICN
jgi:hypothetical protein